MDLENTVQDFAAFVEPANAVDALESIAASKRGLGSRLASDIDNLIHPVRRSGEIFGWESQSAAICLTTRWSGRSLSAISCTM